CGGVSPASGRRMSLLETYAGRSAVPLLVAGAGLMGGMDGRLRMRRCKREPDAAGHLAFPSQGPSPIRLAPQASLRDAERFRLPAAALDSSSSSCCSILLSSALI